MRATSIVCCSWLLALHVTAGKPPKDDVAANARWQVNNSNWGMIATTSVHLNGTAFGNPISVTDALGDGTPYFYVSMMDTSMKDIAANPHVTLTLSEAAIDCQTLGLDPEDPRCMRTSFSGLMVNVSDANEAAKAKEALFARHPSMKHWPSDHSWLIFKLEIQHIWLIDFFGGASDIPMANYTAARPTSGLVPVNASHTPSTGKPFFTRKVKTARWLAHESRWGYLATTSVHLNGTAFGNAISAVDGTPDKSTGIPYFFVSDLDTSMQDLKQNPSCTFTMSEATVDCAEKNLDPEDPRCVRLALTGKMVDITEKDELSFAKLSLFTAYPDMAQWPTSHDFHFTKLEIERIWLIDFFGGATDVSLKEYYATNPTLTDEVIV